MKRLALVFLLGAAGLVVGQGQDSFVDQEVPSGVVDGTNIRFYTYLPPNPISSLVVYRNGLRQKMCPTCDMVTFYNANFTSGTVRFNPCCVPKTGDVLLVSYRLATSGMVSLTGPVSVPAGTPYNLFIVTSGGAGYAGLEFTINMPLDVGSGFMIGTGPVALAAKKTGQCGAPSNGQVQCLVFGDNSTAMTDGIVAVISIMPGGPQAVSELFSLSAVSGATGTGSSITTAIGPLLSVQITPAPALLNKGAQKK